MILFTWVQPGWFGADTEMRNFTCSKSLARLGVLGGSNDFHEGNRMMAAEKLPQLRGTLLFDEPMARHTSWRVGGPAQRFYVPADLEDLSVFLRSLPADEALLWLGLGSNLLVRDGGFAGTVIALHAALDSIELTSGLTVRAEAGVPCAKVARFCARNDLVGAEFLVGIPGTMGGALAMNAGAFGGVTWEQVSAV